MATALTYRTSERNKDLRTVVVEDVRASAVLLPQGRMDVVTAKLLHGTACRCSWWAEVLGTDPASDDFAVAASQILVQREMQVAVKARDK